MSILDPQGAGMGRVAPQAKGESQGDEDYATPASISIVRALRRAAARVAEYIASSANGADLVNQWLQQRIRIRIQRAPAALACTSSSQRLYTGPTSWNMSLRTMPERDSGECWA